MQNAELSAELMSKLLVLQKKLGTEDLDSALDKSLNIANFVVDTIDDPESKLLVARGGKYTELKEVA